jgi:hypothetical protein
VNVTATLTADDSFDGNTLLAKLAATVHARLAAAGTEVAHFKMTLSPETGTDLAVVNLVRTDGVPEASHLLQEPLDAGELILNLRAEGDPEELAAVATEALKDTAAAAGIAARVEHAEAFRPGRPVPTHRDSTA